MEEFDMRGLLDRWAKEEDDALLLVGLEMIMEGEMMTCFSNKDGERIGATQANVPGVLNDTCTAETDEGLEVLTWPLPVAEMLDHTTPVQDHKRTNVNMYFQAPLPNIKVDVANNTCDKQVAPLLSPMDSSTSADSSSGDESEKWTFKNKRRTSAKRVRRTTHCEVATDVSTAPAATKGARVAKRIRVCPHCKKLYGSKEGLRLHVHNVHMNDKRHVCEACGMRFVRAGDLRLHFYRLHCLPSARPFPCPSCEKAFASKTEVARHLRTHE